MQQVVIEIGRRAFLQQLNALLLDGWRMVGPATVQAAQRVAGPNCPRQYIGAEGLTFDHVFIATIEIDERADPEAAERARAILWENKPHAQT